MILLLLSTKVHVLSWSRCFFGVDVVFCVHIVPAWSVHTSEYCFKNMPQLRQTRASIEARAR